jgi:hypothetical protein
MYSVSWVLYATDPTFVEPVVGSGATLSPPRPRKLASTNRRGR